MQQSKKKSTFSGSLAWRISIVCLLFLALPLLLHSLMLFRHETRIVETEVRSCMKAIGGGLAQRISERIHFDWELLEARSDISGENHFAVLDGDSLRVGIFVGGEERALSHPLPELFALRYAPFAIDVGFSAKGWEDQWIEPFSIPDTELSLFVGTSSERIYELQTKHFLFRIATFLSLIVFVGGGLVLLLVHRFAKPLKALCLTMKRVGEGAVHSRYVPQWWGFEINSIGIAFNETLDEMLARSQEIEEERMQRVKLAEELKLGQKIQENLLPKKFPTLLDFEISAGFISAQEVGGDFYDIFPLSTKTLIAVADVAGKGISACLFSLGLRSSLRALAANLDSLSEIVQQANQLFLSDAEESSHFATLWIGVLEKRRLSFVNLGHPPALLKRGFSLQELTTDYAALGSMRYESIQAQSINLEEGDELLLFSDGATDAMDSEGQRYGIDRLKESFLKQGGAEEILHRIQLFSQSPVPHDDMTILHLRMI